ncbi:C-type lectin domain family 4 member M-like [Triplophysa dalaica]|uniref:C-type lectin domain family 4 member M-like n=1 Tax=Triplophysa dalaica TaxID=1582913 RepID=UPI0024DF8EF0|nr:C-type lectin domain family 4 member M-like [Triplophysa dalaica]
MEVEAIYENIQDKFRNTVGHQPQSRPTGAQSSRRKRWFVPITACLGIICVLLVIALILLYVHLTAERDQMNMTYMNKAEEYNETVNSLKINYSHVTDERDQLKINLKSVREMKLKLETNYSHLTDERDQLKINLTSMSEMKLKLETRVKNLSETLMKSTSAYFITNEEKSWTDSRQFCRDRGGDLVIINTEEEQKYISSIVKGRAWIGLSDIEKEGSMTWVDNTPLNKGFWYKGEPNDANGNEDCVEILILSENIMNWNDLPCSEKRKWISKPQNHILLNVAVRSTVSIIVKSTEHITSEDTDQIMEMEAIYGNIPHKIGSETQNQNRSEAQNSRKRLVWITVCLGLICVLLLIALIVLYIHLTAESEQMKKRYLNIVENYNKNLSSLTDERDQLQINLKSISEIKLKLQTDYSHLTDERDQLQINLTSMSEMKLELETNYSHLTNVSQHFYSVMEKKLELETRVKHLSDELMKNLSGSCRYFISSEKKSWSDSRQFCRNRGGDLVIINTEEEQKYISSLVEERAWIGLSDIEKEGDMKWVDNTPLTKGFWTKNEPNNDGNEDCVEIWNPKQSLNNWNDLPCLKEIKWVCEN